MTKRQHQQTVTPRRKHVNGEFPLWQHANGQWCKKINQRTYYFGTDKAAAEAEYWRTVTAIKLGTEHPEEAAALRTLGEIANEFLDHTEGRFRVGEIKERQYNDLRWYLRRFVEHFSTSRKILELKTYDLQEYRTLLINQGLAGHSVNHEMGAVKQMFLWAHANERIFQIPNMRAIKKIYVKPVDRQVFTAKQIRDLLTVAGTNMRAMILLGLNCGLGCTDCAELRWKDLAKENGRLVYPRIKTGINRNLKFWPTTIQALEAVWTMNTLRRIGTGPEDQVFLTKQGNPYVQPTRNSRNPDSALTKEFGKLLRKAKIPKQKGTGFYSLRRTGATLTAKSGDVFAVKGFLGHAGLEMATRYVQQSQLVEQTDRATDQSYQRLQAETMVKDPAPGDPSSPADPASDDAGGDTRRPAPGQQV